MPILTLEEAQARLPDLIQKLAPGNEVIITDKDLPVAKLVLPLPEKPQPIPGTGKGSIKILKEDSEHLADFEEYLP